MFRLTQCITITAPAGLLAAVCSDLAGEGGGGGGRGMLGVKKTPLGRPLKVHTAGERLRGGIGW